MIRNNFSNYYDLDKFKLSIALYEPQIPPNTGNIARLCACSGVDLYLIGKLGFSIDNRYLKRAGLDYWNNVFIDHYNDFENYYEKVKPKNMVFATTSADKYYWEFDYNIGDHIILGSETHGIPKNILNNYPEKCVTIPMKKGLRSINLSTSAGIIIYEAIRQLAEKEGKINEK